MEMISLYAGGEIKAKIELYSQSTERIWLLQLCSSNWKNYSLRRKYEFATQAAGSVRKEGLRPSGMG